jgi:hypothetical protein
MPRASWGVRFAIRVVREGGGMAAARASHGESGGMAAALQGCNSQLAKPNNKKRTTNQI